MANVLVLPPAAPVVDSKVYEPARASPRETVPARSGWTKSTVPEYVNVTGPATAGLIIPQPNITARARRKPRAGETGSRCIDHLVVRINTCSAGEREGGFAPALKAEVPRAAGPFRESGKIG